MKECERGTFFSFKGLRTEYHSVKMVYRGIKGLCLVEEPSCTLYLHLPGAKVAVFRAWNVLINKTVIKSMSEIHSDCTRCHYDLNGIETTILDRIKRNN